MPADRPMGNRWARSTSGCMAVDNTNATNANTTTPFTRYASQKAPITRITTKVACITCRGAQATNGLSKRLGVVMEKQFLVPRTSTGR